MDERQDCFFSQFALLRCVSYDTVRDLNRVSRFHCPVSVQGSLWNKLHSAQPEDAVVVRGGGGGPPRGGAPDGGDPATDTLSTVLPA